MDTAHTSNEIQAPGVGGIGNARLEEFGPRGSHHQNLLQNDSPDNVVNSALQILEPELPVLLTSADYRPEYGPLMYDFFSKREKSHVSYETFVWKNGEVREKKITVPNPPPHFSEFARTLGVTKKIIENWAKKNSDFGMYYEACKDIIEEFYIDNGLIGNYSGQFAIFAAKNETNMRDVHVNKNENYNMKDVLDAIEKGKEYDGSESHDF